MYKTKQELLKILDQYGLAAKKELGQNFLINFGVIEKIVKAAGITKEDFVVEVGPGLGVLTQELIQTAGRVRSIELDPTLHPILEQAFGAAPNFQLEKGNALKATLPTQPYKLVANIPYHITSPLLRHFLMPRSNEEQKPTTIVLLIQKEVAEKICAPDGDHSVLSLSVQAHGKPEIISEVGAKNFYPPPKVTSAILKINIYDKPLITNLKLFSTITKITFAARRKTLLNTLKNYTRTSREETEHILQKAGIEPTRRPQTLSLKEWQSLITQLDQ
ncbi:ribosomal RNA small subunit methyltransferase A [Candidatus Peregrinibacteria bacterium]|nr:ribosomal RNA small subunit methyltransferase A [Candidatus Peregrinibacteria bacterium]